MLYTGIDYHKRYSVACTLDAQGRRLSEAKITQNTPEGFAAYFAERIQWGQVDKPYKINVSDIMISEFEVCYSCLDIFLGCML
ncbi:MAG: hypothetical protein HZA31_10850 [Opitutae bacterium]|nr:hypothetical protein [Opitutae bacterium]